MGGIYSKISNNKKEKDLIKNLQNLQVRVIAYLISKGIMSDDLVEEFAKYYSNTIKDEFNLKDIYNERNIIEEANTLSRRILEQNANIMRERFSKNKEDAIEELGYISADFFKKHKRYPHMDELEEHANNLGLFLSQNKDKWIYKGKNKIKPRKSVNWDSELVKVNNIEHNNDFSIKNNSANSQRYGRFLVTKEPNLSDNDLKVTKNLEKIDEMKSFKPISGGKSNKNKKTKKLYKKKKNKKNKKSYKSKKPSKTENKKIEENESPLRNEEETQVIHSIYAAVI